MVNKIEHEKKTVELMIRLYCRGNHHTTNGLCESCQMLHDYANQRVDKCRFGENKPTCELCKVHCYKKDMREQIRLVMRYSGPRMLLHYPVRAIRHLFKNARIKVRRKFNPSYPSKNE
jgi:Nitrous oxide-stimulated promoter.